MVSPCTPWRSMVEQISGGPHVRAGGVPKEDYDSMGRSCWSRVLEGPVDPWRENPWSSRFSGRTCDPKGSPHWSSLFLKDCTQWKGFTKKCSLWEAVHEGLYPMGVPPYLKSGRRKEQQRQCIRN